MELTPLQQQVFDKAKAWLEKEEWYTGVCMDNFPTDEEITKDGIDHAVERVYDETYMWDGPVH